MKRTNTKRALLLSVLSMMLCVAMLAGSTFAWFTDSVSTGKNRIVAGNLDVELYHSNGKVSNEQVGVDTKLFVSKDDSEIKWEPGVMVYENFTVKNAGSLALKYKLTLNAVCNTVDGKSLKDVLKVAILDKETFDGDRTAAMELPFDKSFDDFVKPGNLAKNADEDTYAIVIYWEPSAMDNDYNFNNERKDLEPLYVDIGVTLVATQDTVENDSFGNQYDKNANYPTLPNIITASVSGKIEENAETVLRNNNAGITVTIPANTTDASDVTLAVKTESSSVGAITYDIKLTDENGNKVELNKKIAVELNVGKGFIDVAVKHNGIPMNVSDYSYDPASGIVTILSDSFSPFEVTYNEVPKVSTADELVAAFNNGGTYAMSSNITVDRSLVVAEGKALTLDLAGKTLTVDFNGWSVVNNGTLTINDTEGTGIICNTNTDAGDATHFILRNEGTMTVNGGTFGDTDTDTTNANTTNWGAALIALQDSTTVINGGNFTCGDNYWDKSIAGSTFSYAIRNYGDMTINGGTVYGKMNGGIASSEGEIFINGGEFSLTGSNTYYVLVTGGSGAITVNDGTFKKIDDNNKRLIGGYSGMPSWDAIDDLAENGYTINGGTFILNGETVILEPSIDEGNTEDSFA